MGNFNLFQSYIILFLYLEKERERKKNETIRQFI